MALNKNWVIDKGATFYKSLTWKDKNGTANNLTGFTARMHIREAIDSASTILTLTTENSRITLGGAAGTIVLEISATDTAAITQSEAVYDLELVSGSGFVTRLLEGNIEFTEEVTR